MKLTPSLIATLLVSCASMHAMQEQKAPYSASMNKPSILSAMKHDFYTLREDVSNMNSTDMVVVAGLCCCLCPCITYNRCEKYFCPISQQGSTQPGTFAQTIKQD